MLAFMSTACSIRSYQYTNLQPKREFATNPLITGAKEGPIMVVQLNIAMTEWKMSCGWRELIMEKLTLSAGIWVRPDITKHTTSLVRESV